MGGKRLIGLQECPNPATAAAAAEGSKTTSRSERASAQEKRGTEKAARGTSPGRKQQEVQEDEVLRFAL